MGLVQPNYRVCGGTSVGNTGPFLCSNDPKPKPLQVQQLPYRCSWWTRKAQRGRQLYAATYSAMKEEQVKHTNTETQKQSPNTGARANDTLHK